MNSLTEQERKVLDLLAEAWNVFVSIPDKREHDNSEFVTAIHQAQRCVGILVARRVDPHVWRTP